MYPVVHKRPGVIRSFDRLDNLWERYPQYHEKKIFSTMEELLPEHESWKEGFEEVREEYDAGNYDRFLVQLSWSDLPYRYETKELIRKAGPLAANPYAAAFFRMKKSSIISLSLTNRIWIPSF